MVKPSVTSQSDKTVEYKSLDDWLAWQTTLHAREIELGLDRIHKVAKSLNLIDCPFVVITVAGTNGKGSTVALLSSILHHAGYKVGTYTSPHITRYNERIRIGLRCVEDRELCASFSKINAAREQTSLSFFEFATLAALDIFHQNKVDVAVLEVGLGGRLDATNLIDSDLAFITSIGLDHTEYLGDTRELIAAEKAGIFRTDKPAICGELEPPPQINETAKRLNTHLYQLNDHFSFEVAKSSWSFTTEGYQLTGLPMPNLSGAVQIRNAANVIMGLHCISGLLPINLEAIKSGLREVTLEGRFQRIIKDCEIILDVAHNYQSASILAENLAAVPKPSKTIAVFSVLSDKDVDGIIALMHPYIDDWYISMVKTRRAMDITEIKKAINKHAANSKIVEFDSVDAAYAKAQSDTKEGDRIVVFGSIFTVSEVIACEL